MMLSVLFHSLQGCFLYVRCVRPCDVAAGVAA